MRKTLEIDNPYPILAVDSAKVVTGWAVLESKGLHEHGVIKTKGDKWRDQLTYHALYLIAKYRPVTLVVEYPYLGSNPDTVIKLAIAMSTWYHAGLGKVERYIEVPAEEWQSAIMSGRFKKRKWLKAMAKSIAESTYGVKLGEDESDAICIGLWAERLWQISKVQRSAPTSPQRSPHQSRPKRQAPTTRSRR